MADWRINGNLNLSRALGDLEYKQDKNLTPEKQIITAAPELKKIVKINKNSKLIKMINFWLLDVMEFGNNFQMNIQLILYNKD